MIEEYPTIQILGITVIQEDMGNWENGENIVIHHESPSGHGHPAYLMFLSKWGTAKSSKIRSLIHVFPVTTAVLLRLKGISFYRHFRILKWRYFTYRPYFVRIFSYTGLKNRLYIWLVLQSSSGSEMAIDWGIQQLQYRSCNLELHEKIVQVLLFVSDWEWFIPTFDDFRKW